MAIRGQITRIIKPLFGRLWGDLAALRMLIETPDGNGKWETKFDICKSTDFILEDRSGNILVEHSQSADIVGTAMQPDREQIRELLAVNQLPVEFNNRYLHYKVWMLRQGETVEVAGARIENRALFARSMGATMSEQHLTSVNQLAPGNGDYCIHGAISLVARPIDDDPDRPLALVRLVVHSKDEFDNWIPVHRQPLGRVSDFCLKDETGSIWVARHPDIRDDELLLPGIKPRTIDDEQTRRILHLLGEDELPRGRQYRNQVWELRLNDQVTVCGEVNTWWMVTYRPMRFRIP